MTHLRKWTQGDYQLDLWDTESRDENGKHMLAYRLKHKGKMIFNGSDFCASPFHVIDSDDTVASILGFLSLDDGDTDPEYFDDYTPEQIAWRDEFAAELSGIVYTMEA